MNIFLRKKKKSPQVQEEENQFEYENSSLYEEPIITSGPGVKPSQPFSPPQPLHRPKLGQRDRAPSPVAAAANDDSINRDSGRGTWCSDADDDDDESVYLEPDVDCMPKQKTDYESHSCNDRSTRGAKKSSTSSAGPLSPPIPVVDPTALLARKDNLRKVSQTTCITSNGGGSVDEQPSSDSGQFDDKKKNPGFQTIRKKFQMSDACLQAAAVLGTDDVKSSAVRQPTEPMTRTLSAASQSAAPTTDTEKSTACKYQPKEQSQAVDEASILDSYPWFFGEISRKESLSLLEELRTQDGTFIVRHSQNGGAAFPFTIDVSFNGELFHVKIGVRELQPKMYALGDKKPNESLFSSVAEVIQFYHYHGMDLLRLRKPVGHVKLTTSPRKSR